MSTSTPGEENHVSKTPDEGASCETQADSDLSEEIKQQELRAKYIEQMKRLSCPGCGDAPFLD